MITAKRHSCDYLLREISLCILKIADKLYVWNRLRDDGGPKNVNDLRDPDHAPFRGWSPWVMTCCNQPTYQI